MSQQDVVKHESNTDDIFFPECEYMQIPSAFTFLTTTSDPDVATYYYMLRETNGLYLKDEGDNLPHETFCFTRDISFPISFRENTKEMFAYIQEWQPKDNGDDNEAETGDQDEEEGPWMIGNKSNSMEEKWDSYCDREKKQIYFAHSWTGSLMYRVRFDIVQDRLVLLDFDMYSMISIGRNDPQDQFYMTKEQEIEFGARMCEWLIGNEFLGLMYPLWLPEVPQWTSDTTLATWVFSQCGSRGIFVAEHPFNRTTDWIVDRLIPEEERITE